MVSSLFDSGREAFALGNHAWGTDATRLILVDEGTDTPSITADDNLDDILAGAREAESANFTYPASPALDGIINADDVTLSAVSGDTVESLVIFRETGTESTSTLLIYIDTVTPAFPFTPNGGDVTVAWDNGANLIATI